jgi:hypothetical protein
MAAPNMTFGAAGNIRASASLAASGTATYDVDYSTKLEGQVTTKNTPGGTIASTRGVRVDVYARYSSAPSVGTIAIQSLTLPSAVASTAESATLYLSTGKYRIAITNLDGTNAVTVEITGDTVDSIS